MAWLKTSCAMAAEVPGIAISIRLPPLPGLHSHEVATEFRNRASRVRLECDGRYDIEGDYHGEWEACRILRTAPPEDPWDSTCCRCDVECAADGTIVRGVHPDLLRARRSTGVPRDRTKTTSGRFVDQATARRGRGVRVALDPLGFGPPVADRNSEMWGHSNPAGAGWAAYGSLYSKRPCARY